MISDLHSNFWSDPNCNVRSLYDKWQPKIKADAWIVAGDLRCGTGTKPVKVSPNVFILPGNHDYYYTPIDISVEFLFESGLLCTPLWTDFKLPGDQYNKFTSDQVYRAIRDSKSIPGTSVDLISNLFSNTIKLIRMTQPDIIATHFPPSMQSIHIKYANDPINTYFVNDLESFIEEVKPSLWVCGHVHHRHSYYVSDTLVACNPLGYPGENYSSVDQYQPMVLLRDENNKWFESPQLVF